MIYNSTVYKNRRGDTVVIPINTVDSNSSSVLLRDILAIVLFIVLCIASSIVNVA